MYLKRWYATRKHPEGGAVQALALFPLSWNGYTSFWLTAGDEGDLVFSSTGSTNTARRSLLARFVVNAVGTTTFPGLQFSSVLLAAEPSLRAKEVVYSIVSSGQPKNQSSYVTDLRPPAAADAPQML